MSKPRRRKPASNLGRVLGRLLNSHFLKALSQEGDSHPSFLILLQPQSQATPPPRTEGGRTACRAARGHHGSGHAQSPPLSPADTLPRATGTSQLRAQGLGSRGRSRGFTCPRRGAGVESDFSRADGGGHSPALGAAKEGNSPPQRAGTRQRRSGEEPRGWGVTCRR